ncbi:MAG TPA: nickel pincer cofactor biosynthesis protein LarC [Dictyoglomaceae bacterium]|nr:nickel pincer cofactor biosynthesis protein LarC [Dictyoglomaceae bacterium]HOL39185.1 nickel pincer cofactor biosynthesis protein LarC [Dictyoglomaceae bacterium]HOP94206.1 nickel pincer cofactor biosynthesis protein LarC [Dictyoglomaceae bacterium]HPP15339.1 nickel pincer cofactor biosynthesis protein LarC [Dictyoglomaceae bacterium]HPU43615.1 nickel pincer cofactor biosynthesis protein LarC [Dictyoglomaceae bacterium]
MRIIYFDCFSGISGDMILGALLDAGVDVETWKKELDKIPIDEYKLEISKKKKGALYGTDVDVIIEDQVSHRHLSELLDILDRSTLSKNIKEKGKEIFYKIAEAESKIHGEPIEEVHFHEIGAIDTIIDVLGSLIALELLEIETIYSSPLPLGRGFVDTSHGRIPVPAPATLEILKGVPVYVDDREGELVTPTGAAIISTLSCSFGDMPHMRLEKIGYGAGKKDFSVPNLLRVFMGEKIESFSKEKNVMLETNIDDMNPQILGYLTEKLFKEGALDVFITPVYMKKGRPGMLLTVITTSELEDRISEIIFRETTTLGIRKYYVDKKFMEREIKEIDTSWGKVRYKKAKYNNIEKAYPEYEDCKKIAERENIPIKDIIFEIKKLLEEKGE